MSTTNDRFPSVAAIREAHAALVAADPPPSAKVIGEFIARIRACGVVLATRAERTEAQNVINYWANTLYTTPAQTAGTTAPIGPAVLESMAFGPSSVWKPLPAAGTVLERFDPATAPTLPDSDNPFKGLAAFGTSDASRFFGRDDVGAELERRVRATPVVVITGPSGAGKSSVVLAGLVPKLEVAGPDGTAWQVLGPVIPGTDPLAALVALARSVAPGTDLTTDRLAASPMLFRDAVGLSPGGPVLLVVDQFEEIFTLCESPPAREAFAAAVVGLASGPGQHRVILTVREDYAEQTFQLAAMKPLAADPATRFAPPAMSSRDLRRVIERPAELVGLKFDEGIVDDLVKEVAGETTALPLLQFALTKLWENRNRNRITREAYLKVGSPREALKRTAEAVYDSLLEDTDKRAARLLFLDLLRPTVGVEVVRKRMRRESLRRHAAVGRVDEVLRRFTDAGLLRMTKGADTEDDRFEVGHEALIRNWPRLSDWLQEKQRTSEKELRVAATAKLWADAGRCDGYLLTGPALDEAAAYAGASPEVADLVAASRAKQARDARRRARVRRAVILVLSLLCVALAITTWRALRNADEARVAQKTAELNAIEARNAQAREAVLRQALELTAEADSASTQVITTLLMNENPQLAHAAKKLLVLQTLGQVPFPLTEEGRRVAAANWVQLKGELMIHDKHAWWFKKTLTGQDREREEFGLQIDLITTSRPADRKTVEALRTVSKFFRKWIVFDSEDMNVIQLRDHAFARVRKVLVREVTVAADRISASADEGRPAGEVSPFRNMFWHLYSCELVMFEANPDQEPTFLQTVTAEFAETLWEWETSPYRRASPEVVRGLKKSRDKIREAADKP
jgi:hypothetical protein